MIAELTLVLEGNNVDDKMTVQIVCVQTDGDEYLIFVAPHSVGCLSADGKCFFRRDFSRPKALIPVKRKNSSRPEGGSDRTKPRVDLADVITPPRILGSIPRNNGKKWVK